MPLPAKSDTSGRSRTPSSRIPANPACHDGFFQPLQLPLTTPRMEGVPLAQPLGPPLPPIVVRKFVWYGPLLQ